MFCAFTFWPLADVSYHAKLVSFQRGGDLPKLGKTDPEPHRTPEV